MHPQPTRNRRALPALNRKCLHDSKNLGFVDGHELDEFIMFLNDALPMPLEAKYRTGLYALVTFSLNGRAFPPWETWIKHMNHALAPRWPQIEADFRTVLKNLHPDQFGQAL